LGEAARYEQYPAGRWPCPRQTNGSLTVLELVIGPKQGPALHTHLREDELWYVLDGDFRFKTGGAMFRVSTGGMAFGPRGTPHAFQALTAVGDANWVEFTGPPVRVSDPL
jgi:quercetin dioxygenase-like cupin family protein